ncbi:MAG: FGGY-family carbohydrate kinase [Candidatus Anstonellales archaeon]
MIYIGVDLGTHGLKYFVSQDENIVENNKIIINAVISQESGFEEQNPSLWGAAFLQLIDYFKAKYKKFILCISSTSGSVLPVDRNGKPLYNAIMYNDNRSVKEAQILNLVAFEFTRKLGYKFNASFSLPKILWIKNNLPHIYKITRYFLHPADYLVFLASGVLGVTDYSNSLKSGFDILEYKWPGFIEEVGIDIEKLPKVYSPTFKVSDSVVLGMTDGCASQIATGSFDVGNSMISVGSTLVIKAVSKKLNPDPEGRFYYHLNFDKKTFLPGGASNAGGTFFEKNFSLDEIESFSEHIKSAMPSEKLIYPIIKRGERFPFFDPNFVGLDDPSLLDNKKELFKSSIEGLAYISRYAFETLSQFSIEFLDNTYVVGPMFNYSNILKIFANILNKTIVKTKYSDASFGDLLLAMISNNIEKEEIKKIIGVEEILEPDAISVPLYLEKYLMFKERIEKNIGGNK